MQSKQLAHTVLFRVHAGLWTRPQVPLAEGCTPAALPCSCPCQTQLPETPSSSEGAHRLGSHVEVSEPVGRGHTTCCGAEGV